MKVSEIMTANVVTIGQDATVNEAIRLMLQNKVSGLPVVDAAGAVVGIVTEGDFLRRVETGTEVQRPRWLQLLAGTGKLADEYVRAHGRKVSEVMTPDVAAADENTEIGAIVETMEKRRIKRVPVVRGRKLVGMVTRADILRALARAIPAGAKTAAPSSDLELRNRVVQELGRLPWATRNTISVTVKNGAVELQGAIFNVKEREALRVAAENVPGVTAVHDHLVWVEPVSGMALDVSPSS
jgi:CBS domain-containing protein